jgi:hypothetical protein
METRKILTITIFTIAWMLVATNTQAVLVQTDITKPTISQNIYAGPRSDSPFLIVQLLNGSSVSSQSVITPLVTDDLATVTAFIPEDSTIENFGLVEPSLGGLNEFTIQTNEAISRLPVTPSNVALANLTLPEGSIAANRPVSERQSGFGGSLRRGTNASVYDFQYPYSFGYPYDFGFWYPFGFWYAPFVEEHHFHESIVPNGVGETLTAIPEPATLVLLGLGTLICLYKRR